MIVNAAATNMSVAMLSGASGKTSSANVTSVSELTEEEKKYDADNDGVLSATEKMAMYAAQAETGASKARQTGSVPNSGADTVSISKEGWQKLAEAQAKLSEPESEAPDDLSKAQNTLSMTAPSSQQWLMDVAISEYQKFNANTA